MAGQSLGLAKERRNVKREEKDMNGKDGRGKEEELEQVRKMLAFIRHSPTCYQAVENVGKELEMAGYGVLQEEEPWELAMGGKYYVTRNGSSLIAFQLPAGRARGFHMVASHSDSPCFKVKENPEMAV